MNHFLPDWMFAAFAIGGWELFHFLARATGIPKLIWVSWGIVAVCALVLGIRYIVRFIQRLRRKEEPPGPDDWKNY